MDKQLRELLKATFDRELTPDEDIGLSNAMQSSLELQEEKKHFEKVRVVMKKYHPAFKQTFVAGVMARIAGEKESQNAQGFVVAFYRIALPLLAAASVLLLFSLFNNGGITFDSILGVENLEPQYLSEFLLFNY
ncbi:MAG: hypothetical protein IH598_09880 [Bacteroidales bacterium]|nr:hypothetical protein [Bacteroidales bacterium]